MSFIWIFFITMRNNWKWLRINKVLIENKIKGPWWDKFPNVDPPPPPIDPKVGTSLAMDDPKTVAGAAPDEAPKTEGAAPKTWEDGAARAPNAGGLPKAGAAPKPDLTGVVCPTPNPWATTDPLAPLKSPPPEVDDVLHKKTKI